MIDMKEERSGFSGLNHVLIAIMLFFIMLLVPVEPFTSFLNDMVKNPFVGVMAFLTVCGGALLPDMDNPKSEGGSAASWSLGIVGTVISVAMVTISSVMTSVFKGKRDVKPYTQHRFFWHTGLVPLLMFLAMFFLLPNSDTKVLDAFAAGGIDVPFELVISMILVSMCMYVGSLTLLKRVRNIIRFNTQYISLGLTAVTLIAILFLFTESDLKLLSYCVALGYAFHLVGDLFADGGIPLLFPVTGLFGAFFKKIRLVPVTVTTGSTLESMLKLVFAVADFGLAYLVFLHH